ncbi:hypothetical protein P3L10_012224 [Capsicum annuum]
MELRGYGSQANGGYTFMCGLFHLSFTTQSHHRLKCTRIEIHLVTSNGLELLLDVPIYGRIATLELFRPNGETQDLLFIATERHEYCVLQWDAKAYEFITRSNGNLAGRNRPMDTYQIGSIDPDCRLIGLLLYDALFKFIHFDEEGKLKEAFSIRYECCEALDMKFLYGCQKPTFVVIYKDNKNARHVKAYEVPLENGPNIEQREIWALNNIDNGAYLLLQESPPLCGVLIIGENVIVYCCNASAANVACPIEHGLETITAYDQVDAHRYLLGDHNGGLHLLAITHEKEKVTGVRINYLGETSIASTISYLCDPFIYIGSSYGDSQLSHGSLNRYDNLGPIADFCIVDCEKLGQRQVVTCSGAYEDGSLRIARNKIGIHEQVSVELRGIKGMWSLRSTTDDSYDSFLVVSFIDVTLFYQIVVDETSREGFTSLSLAEASIDVTPNSVRLVNSVSKHMKTEWFAPGQLTVATAKATQILLATTVGGHQLLVCLTIGNGVLKKMASIKLGGDVSCLDINPIATKANSSIFAAVGMWEDNSINIYSLPKLDFIGKENLGGVDSLPRSVLMCSFDGRSYLLCGLNDGHLTHFELNMSTGELIARKKESIGNQPITLCTFLSKEATRVVAASNSLMVIYSNNNKILYSEVNNIEGVIHMSPYYVEAFPNMLAIAKEGQLAICTIDEKQKLHIIHSEHLGEYVRYISHQEQSRIIAICSITYEGGNQTDRLVRLFDDQRFQRKSTYIFDQFEYGCSILSCSFSDDNNVYYCVGTAYVMPNQNELTKGRILVLQVVLDGEFQLVAQMETNGAVYSLNAFNGKLLAAINQNIQLYKWASCEFGRGRKLQPECLYHGRVLSLYVRTRGDFIVVGDLVMSISLLICKQDKEEYVIEQLAYHCAMNWMSAVEILSDDIYLGARTDLDLFTFTKHSESTADEQHKHLEVAGTFYLGEFVTRFRQGPLVTLSQDSEMIPSSLAL